MQAKIIAVVLAAFTATAVAAQTKEPAKPAKSDGRMAQQEKMKKCNADAKGKKGDERKKFMSECLKG